ncbi:MAG: right-handed parallel beta-helix repeat-containing protein [Planctomycetes bacterium]|nr:right-handed parallel beta-helix repeat-containing protein [Planctomycetota bacterium]
MAKPMTIEERLAYIERVLRGEVMIPKLWAEVLRSGEHSVELGADYVQILQGTPGNPPAGSTRIYSPSDRNVTIRDSAGNTDDLVGLIALLNDIRDNRALIGFIDAANGINPADTDPIGLAMTARLDGSGIVAGVDVLSDLTIYHSEVPIAIHEINRLLDVYFPVDANTGYIVGDGGTVLKTTAGASSDLVLHPTGDGSMNSFSSATGCPGGNWDCVNDQTGNAGTGKWEADDDLTSYLQDPKDAVGREMFSLDNGLIPAGATVTSIDIYATVGRTGGPSPSASLSYQRVGGQDLSPIDAPAVTISATNTGQDISASFGCLGWPDSDLDDLEIGIVHVSGGKFNITQIYVIVHYETTKVNYRSIGTGGTIYSAGTASAPACSNVVTFGGASLPTTVGRGDKLLIAGTETRYIYSRDSATQVTLQDPVTNDYTSGATYSISRAYGTLQAWEDDRQGDLVAGNRREVGVCYNDATPFTSGVVIDGSTTDADHYLTLTVAEGQRHDGTAGSGARIDAGGGFGVAPIYIQNQYTRVEWLEVFGFNDGMAAVKTHIDANGAYPTIENMIMHDYTGGYPGAGVSVNAAGATVRNCIIYDGSPFGIYVGNSPSGAVIQNCTIYDTGIDGLVGSIGSTVSITNTISLGSGTDVTLIGSVTAFGNNMFSTTFGFDPAIYTGNQSPPADLENLFISIGLGFEDLHLEPTGHTAGNRGLDLSIDFTDDIDGATRTGTWDIGADEAILGTAKPRIVRWEEVDPY